MECARCGAEALASELDYSPEGIGQVCVDCRVATEGERGSGLVSFRGVNLGALAVALASFVFSARMVWTNTRRSGMEVVESVSYGFAPIGAGLALLGLGLCGYGLLRVVWRGRERPGGLRVSSGLLLGALGLFFVVRLLASMPYTVVSANGALVSVWPG